MKDRKGTENHVADHLSILEEEVMIKLRDGAEIDDVFPYDKLLSTYSDLIPWFVDFSNNVERDSVPLDLYFH